MTDSEDILFVVKRDGSRAPVRFDAITDRNELLTHSVYGGRSLTFVRPRLAAITQAVAARFQNGMSTQRLDLITAEVCEGFATRHTDYSDLAARIYVSNLQKTTPDTFSGAVAHIHAANGRRLSPEFRAVVARGGAAIDGRVRHERDFLFSSFGFSTIQRSYLFREGDRNSPTVERPQYAYMRVAIQLCLCRGGAGGEELTAAEFGARLERAFRVYDLLSTHRLSNATSTVLNSGTRNPQMASCFLVACDDDLRTLAGVVRDIILISAAAGGIGISLDPMRAEGALIRTTGGQSTGIRWYDNLLDAARLWANQGNLRKGAFAAYLTPHHDDTFTFLELGRLTQGGVVSTPDIKFAMWVPDLFMEATLAELADPAAGDWHLFSPDEAPGLHRCYGEEYRALYAKYVAEKKFRRVVKPSQIWAEWFRTVVQRGHPYIVFKDHVNHKSNLSVDAAGAQRTITHSNLCTEISIPAVNDEGKYSEAEYGTCNLGAVVLGSFVVGDPRAPSGVRMDWAGIIAAAGEALENIDNLVDANSYPVEPCRRSNNKFRPAAIGVIGVQDVFDRFRYVYGSPEALRLDQALRAAIYLGAMRRSVELGRTRGNFPAFEGSRTHRGKIQPDLWVEAGHLDAGWPQRVERVTGGAIAPSDWDDLRRDAAAHLRNGYVTAEMPTATTSQVVGQNECGEPRTTNLYTRSTLAGEKILLNRRLQDELIEDGRWDDQTRAHLIATGGSVQGLAGLSENLRLRYRTAREIPQESLVDHAAACCPFLSQLRSQNFYFDENLTLKRVLTVLIRSWKLGVPTGSYYIHSAPGGGAAREAKKAPAPPSGGEKGAPAPGGGGEKGVPATIQFDFANFAPYGGEANGLACEGCGV